MSSRLEILAVPGLPEIAPGDDLAAAIARALSAAGLTLTAGEIVVVASKIVAKAEDRYLDVDDDGSAEIVRTVAQRRTPRGIARIVATRSGTVQAAAGIDASNLPDLPHRPPGSATLALPADPDASARALRAELSTLTGAAPIGVIVSDTLGRPWRIGQTDAAIGAAGVLVAEDLSGRLDTSGRPMEVTVRALADQLAGAADLVKGKTSRCPVAVVRGMGDLVIREDGPGAAALSRPVEQDWFRYGHAEAARAALGVEPSHTPSSGRDGGPERAVQPVGDGTWAGETERDRLRRAIDVALTGFGVPPAEITPTADGVNLVARESSPDWFRIGLLAQRIVVAAWAEDLPLRISLTPRDGAALDEGIALAQSPTQCQAVQMTWRH